MVPRPELFWVGLAIGVVVARTLYHIVAVSPKLRAVLVILVPVAALVLAPQAGVRSASLKSQRGEWRPELYVTSQWLKSHPIPGRIGAYDAGLLGYELDPRTVVNLDGLVNDYHYASEVTNGTVKPLVRYRAEGIDVLVGRLAKSDPRRPACATVIWHDPYEVRYDNSSRVDSEAPVVVLNLHPCFTKG